jgi:hypothetical protein
MSSAPVTPKPATPAVTPSIITDVTNDLAWVRTHAVIVLTTIALIAGLVIGSIGLIEHVEEKHDEAVAAADLKKNNVDTAAQQALVAELAKEHADDQARDAQQSALIQSLVAQMAQQHAQTARQVATDATLDAKSAGQRLAAQTGAGNGDVSVGNDTVTMSLPLTRTVVADLDKLQQATSDVTNLTGQLGAQTILTNDAKVELQTANQIIAADKTELVATVKSDNASCVASTKIAVDAEAAKGRKRGFWLTVLGFVGGVLVAAK